MCCAFTAVTIFAVPTALLGSGFARAMSELAHGGQHVCNVAFVVVVFVFFSCLKAVLVGYLSGMRTRICSERFAVKLCLGYLLTLLCYS